jgi:uncharacterized protein
MADIKPPFTFETAKKKVKAAQAAWNTRDPHTCAKAYTVDSIWRNRDQFFQGREAIIAFLTAKWQRELDYRLRKELFAFSDDKIAVQFWYEYRDAEEARKGREVWKRAYGLEDWTFDSEGKMRKRQMSANDIVLKDGERWFTDGVDVDSVPIGEEHW